MKKLIFVFLLVIVVPAFAQETSFETIAMQKERTFGVPHITKISIAPASTAVRIEWETGSDAESFIEYGPSPAYGSRMPLTSEKLFSSKIHRAEIAGLSEFQTYHFRIRAKAPGSENEAFSRPLTFMTLQSGGYSSRFFSPTPSDFGAPRIVSFSVSKDSIIALSADESSSFRLEYGAYVRNAPFIFEEKEQSVERAVSAQFSLRSTTPGSLYVYRLTTQDRYGNRAVMIGNFQTPAFIQDSVADIRKKSKETSKSKESFQNKELVKNKEIKKNKEKHSFTIPKGWILLTHPIQLKVLFQNEIWRDASTGRIYRIVGKQKKPTLISVKNKAVKKQSAKPVKKTAKIKTKANKQEMFIPFYQ